MHLLKTFPTLALFLALAAILPAHAQVAPSAFRDTKSLWIGAEYSNFHASFPYQSDQRLQGIGGFADFNLNRFLGFEANTRYLRFGGFQSSTESTLLAGPRFFFFPKGRFQPYTNLLVGQATIHYPFTIGDATYLALAPSAGTNFHITHRWAIRVDYEYQWWLNSPGYPNQPQHPLTPNGVHVGITYRLLP
jgi:opacity protein-like surface antigen